MSFVVEEEIVSAFVGDVVTIPSDVALTYRNESDQKARIGFNRSGDPVSYEKNRPR